MWYRNHLTSSCFSSFNSTSKFPRLRETLLAMACGGMNNFANFPVPGYNPSIVNNRRLEFVQNAPNNSHQQKLRVMSYNVLSDDLLWENSKLYYDMPQHVLPFDYRKHLIIKNILSQKTSIVCLQEIDAKHYESFYMAELSKCGYDGRFVKRTGDKVDGVAIFYKKEEFKLLECKEVTYFVGSSEILDRDNVGLIMALQPTDYKKKRLPTRICVANTHLLFNLKRGDIKLAQMVYLLANLHELAQKPGHPHGTYYPCFLCGDFNSTPYSPLYKFVTSGSIDYSQLDKYFISGQLQMTGRCVPIASSILPDFLSHQCTILLGNSIELSAASDQSPVDNRAAQRPPSNSRGKRYRTESQTEMNAPKNHKTDYLAFPEVANNSANNGMSEDAALPNSESVTGDVSSVTTESTSNHSTASLTSLQQQTSNDSAATAASSATSKSKPSPWGVLTHKFKFYSTYKHDHIQRFYPNPHRVPEITTKHSASGGLTVDYIFYTGAKSVRDKSNITLLSRYGLLSVEELEHAGNIPNAIEPSDHLPLVAEFTIHK